MNSLFLISIGAVCLMIIVLTIFSDDIVQGQKTIRENFIKKRKLNLYKITLNSDTNKEFIRYSP